MVPPGFHPAMTRERFPEDADFAPERKQTLAGIMISAGLILCFVGLMLLAIVAITEFSYQTMAVPADVQILLGSTRQTSYALLTVGVGLMVIAFIERQ